MVRQGSPLAYIDAIMLMSKSKPPMLQLVIQLHDFVNKEKLMLAPEKSSFMLLTVKHQGQEIGLNAKKPRQSKLAYIQRIPSATTKIEQTTFIGSMKF